ncbi:hypothetical protein NDU88_001342 [Pleurodeles waltl]|uniref:Uncharacterized protein n=1 Tax=Pleurodeles waltl TaxID=8319 RepID=A0AAV7VBM0_PLEWA|nr:hypothetical protein NDU88_001342 [Pleurodeles waltl]
MGFLPPVQASSNEVPCWAHRVGHPAALRHLHQKGMREAFSQCRAEARGNVHLSRGVLRVQPPATGTRHSRRSFGGPGSFRPRRHLQARSPLRTTLKGSSVLHSPVCQLTPSCRLPDAKFAAKFAARLHPQLALDHPCCSSHTGFLSPRHSRC